MRTLIFSLFLLFSTCSAAVHPSNENTARILRSDAFHELSRRSTGQITIDSDKTELASSKTSYLKRSDLSKHQRELILNRHPYVVIAEELKKQQQQQEQKQQQQEQEQQKRLKPKVQKRYQKNEIVDPCSQICKIS
jgi:Skp family chaperone for outer membrane proteins